MPKWAEIAKILSEAIRDGWGLFAVVSVLVIGGLVWSIRPILDFMAKWLEHCRAAALAKAKAETAQQEALAARAQEAEGRLISALESRIDKLEEMLGLHQDQLRVMTRDLIEKEQHIVRCDAEVAQLQQTLRSLTKRINGYEQAISRMSKNSPYPVPNS